MKVLILYDSVFGNTEKVAFAMRDALASQAAVEARRAADVTAAQCSDCDLLLVGSPTRGFNPTKAVKELLRSLPTDALQNSTAAAFDTRIDPAAIKSRWLGKMVTAFGWAAPKIDKQLRKKGANTKLSPEGFIVTDTEGPLQAGELERAVAWAIKTIA